uniref:Uncharacterized protein n=1 Tax=Rhodotorula toruloides TaxID=5286 RepID=A0A0K3CPV7_RHOTO
MPPTIPINHYGDLRNQQNGNARPILLFHANVRLHQTSTHQEGGPAGRARSSTTSFLTATTLIYAIGAGITAAAGTRLALQLILVKGFKLYSFQLQDP